MRLSAATALLALAACDCGSYPGSGTGDDPPAAIACAGVTAPPVALHDLAAGAAIGFQFSVCGHLLVRVDGVDRLAAPDLAGLAGLPVPEGWTEPRAGFSPTGELLRISSPEGTLLHDLATGGGTVYPPARYEGMLPSHDLGRSILQRCTDEGLVAVDRGEEKLVVPGASCDRHTFSAFLSPVTIATDARERLLVADLESGAVLDTGLPLSEREEPTPEGEPAYRADAGFPSWDGGRILHMKRWEVFRGDTIDYVGPEELRVVEVEGGDTAVYPASAGDVVKGFFRTGFVWGHGWERTYVAGAAGSLAIDRRCNLAEVSPDGLRLLLACYEESGPVRWQDRLVDTGDLSVRELGGPWSVRQLSAAGRAVAGCPVDAWRGGSCTVPVVRRWVDGEGLRELALERPGDVLWVGDDGAVLAAASARDEAWLLGPDGTVRTRFPIAGDPTGMVRVHAADGALLVHVEDGTLDVVVPATGFHARVAERVRAAAFDGARVAFTVPDREGFRLRAGAAPR